MKIRRRNLKSLQVGTAIQAEQADGSLGEADVDRRLRGKQRQLLVELGGRQPLDTTVAHQVGGHVCDAGLGDILVQGARPEMDGQLEDPFSTARHNPTTETKYY